MKTTYTSALVLALSALFAGHAMADDASAPATGKTREQVRAELFEYQAAHRNDVYLPYTTMTVAEFQKDMDAFKHQDQNPTASTSTQPAAQSPANKG